MCLEQNAIYEIKKIAPTLYNLCCKSMKHFVPRERFLYLEQQNCAGMGDTSIDHLVIEKAENIVMIEANFDWMDVGTWGSVLELSKRFNKNFESFQAVTNGREPVLMTENDAKNLLGRVYKQPSKSLMLFINKVKEVKPIRKEIKPWGFYSVVLMGKDFLIKYLFINPLSCTSKQFHHYRDEYHINTIRSWIC